MNRLLIPVIALYSMLHAAEDPAVTLSGTVKDSEGNALENVAVMLAKIDNLTDQTDADGAFTLTNVTSIHLPENLAASYGFTFRNNSIIFTAGSEKATGTVMLFSGNGRLITSVNLDKLHSGTQQITLPELSTGIYILKGTVGGESFTRSFVCMGDNLYAKNRVTSAGNNRTSDLAEKATAAANDTLVFSKEGYDTTRLSLTTYSKADIEVVMDEASSGEFTITSTAFNEGDEMPDKYTCEGKSIGGEIAPPLEWSGIPEEAKCLALFFKDLTAAAGPQPSMGYHWGMWNIPITVTELPEGLGGDAKPAEMGGATQKGAMGNKFFGPCPDYQKKGGIKDTYQLTLYAFNEETITPPADLMQMAKFFEENAFDSTSISVFSDAQPQ